jgi:undecaprenyl phosphate N,N'-diacetylbacillosamine 1-phosphate transferase
MIKRLFDILLAACACAILLVFFIPIAILIKLDSPGPVFFRQDRLGRLGRTITVLKLRTMHVNAQAIFNADGSRHVGKQDARVTRMGHFLRTGFDELTQVYNVLRGEMSFIGPRPDDLFSVNNLEGAEWLKLSVRPGITGLAQLTGRNDLPWKDRLRYDVYYAKNRTLMLDLRITLRTVGVLLKRESAQPLVSRDVIDAFFARPELRAEAAQLQAMVMQRRPQTPRNQTA